MTRITDKCWILIVLCILSTCRADTHEKRHHHGHGTHPCLYVREYLQKNNIDASHLIPNTMEHAHADAVCQREASSRTCCTYDLEQKLVESSGRDLLHAQQWVSSNLIQLLTNASARFQDLFLDMLRSTDNNVSHVLLNNFHIPIVEQRGTVRALFVDLEHSVRRRIVLNVDQSISNFFDQLFAKTYFPKIVHSHVQPTREYSECLRHNRRAFGVFGELPERFAKNLDHAMRSAQTLEDAVTIALELVNSTTYMELDADCKRAVTRLHYCSVCDSPTVMRSCSGFCLNVMRGCLASNAELQHNWVEYVKMLERLTKYLTGSTSLYNTLASFPNIVSDSMLHGRESQHRYYQKVIEACGQFASTGSVPANATEQTGWIQSHTPHLHETFQSEVRLFMAKLKTYENFFETKADTLCQNERFLPVPHTDGDCWNGENVSRYTKNVTVFHFKEQMAFNPEVKVTRSQIPTIMTLKDKLDHLRKLMMKHSEADPSIQRDSINTYRSEPKNDRHSSGGYSDMADDSEYSGDDDYDDEDYSGSGGYPYRPREDPKYHSYPKKKKVPTATLR